MLKSKMVEKKSKLRAKIWMEKLFLVEWKQLKQFEALHHPRVFKNKTGW